jgi:hypothetical protein
LKDREDQFRADLRILQEENKKAAYIFDTMKKETENLVRKNK